MSTTRRRKFVLAIGLVIVLLFSLILSIPNVESVQGSIIVGADTYVKSSELNANYGGADTLYAYKYEYEFLDITDSYNIWLRFNLSTIPSEATINSIILRMHTSFATSDVTNKIGVFLCDNNSWTETGITWNNAPNLSNVEPLQTAEVATPNTNYDFELTSTLKGKTEATLVLKSLQSTALLGWAVFDSRETIFAHAPRLIVDYAMPSLPLNIGLIAGVIIVIIVVVAVLCLYLFKLSKKKGKEKQQEIPPPPA